MIRITIEGKDSEDSEFDVGSSFDLDIPDCEEYARYLAEDHEQIIRITGVLLDGDV